MSSALDNWNQSNKAACLRRFAQEVKEQSKQMFLKDKSHGEIFFFVGDDGQVAILPAPSNVNRDEMVEQFKQTIQENNIYGLVQIAETWAYFRQKPGDHTLTQLMAGEMRVSELRPEDRAEALVVIFESRDGNHHMWITPILRDGDKIALGDTISFTDRLDGRFARLFESD